MIPSKNQFPPPFVLTRPSTRTKNKDARPGAVNMPNPCRTAAEMQAMRDQQASDKQQKESNVILPDGIESDDSDKDRYQPEDTEDMQEDSNEDEFESEEEVVSKKGKKPKPGRCEITAARVTSATTRSKSASSAKHLKRERSPSQSQAGPVKKAKKSNQPPSGLRSGWDDAIKTKLIAPADKTHQEDNNLLARYGGMISDNEDDEMERSAIVNDKGSKRGPNNYVPHRLIQSSLKIELVSSVPRMQREAQGGNAFTKELVPLAKSLAGSLSPWEGFSREQVQELVDKIYGPAWYIVQNAPIDPWAPFISYRLKNWCNGFGTKAAEALRRYIKVDQADFFKNHKIIADWDVPDPERLSEKEKPYRAFILALQAVQHALKAWTTGEYVEPRGSVNHFLADNYSDHTERKSDKGRTINVLVCHATQYMPTVKALTKDHWEAIFKEIANILADNKPKRK
ncbi:hypothetical protein BYT27DRAFT_7226672 [Phlegmacium glaucopus]|nr:hypothetical protein BYT27DRAFT_7226672 [Phlegmacium glaucopus]